MDIIPQRQTYTIEETAKILGLGRSSAYAAAARGEIPTLRIGRKLLVSRKALERLLAGNSTGVGQDAFGRGWPDS